MNLKEFTEQSHISTKLVKAVVSQLGGWDSFKGSAPDISNHGIDGGFAGFTWHTDTVAFFKKNRAAILELAESEWQEIGYEGMFDMFKKFGCMKGYSEDEIAKAIYTGKGEYADQILNCLSWYAGEEVCRSYCDLMDEDW